MRLLLIVLLAIMTPALAQRTPACPQGLSGVGAPPFELMVDGNTGSTWTAFRSYCPRDGAGSFIQFVTPNRAGQQVTGVVLNGGIWDATPGLEQGDLDIAVMKDGAGGYIFAFTNDGLGLSHTDTFELGSQYGRWREIWLTTVPCPPSAPTSECVRVNGGFVPIYR